MRNTGLEEAQAGIKITRRNVNNLWYVDDTTPMAESEQELKTPLMKMKEESEKVGLKLKIQNTKIMASGPISSWQIDGKAMEIVRAFWGGFQNHCDGDCSQEIKRCLFLGRKAMTNLDSMLKSRGITLPTQVHLVNVSGHSTFSLNRFQMSKSKLCSSWNQRLYSNTVWRQASICWWKTRSPWTLMK